MQDTDIIRELREQAKTYTEAADLLEGQVGQQNRASHHATATTRRPLSRAARAKISQAQHKRWEVVKGGSNAANANGGKKKAA